MLPPAPLPLPQPEPLPPQPPMPPLPPARRDVYRHYKLHFLADGYPGKIMPHGVVAHPIYGMYVSRDYLRLHEQTGEQRYLDGARKVLDGAIVRRNSIIGTGAVVRGEIPPDSVAAGVPAKVLYNRLERAAEQAGEGDAGRE